MSVINQILVYNYPLDKYHEVRMYQMMETFEANFLDNPSEHGVWLDGVIVGVYRFNPNTGKKDNLIVDSGVITKDIASDMAMKIKGQRNINKIMELKWRNKYERG